MTCERKVAFDSPDYIEPWGTRRDNSRNLQFNRKIYWLFGTRWGMKKQLRFLDLGCSGGGFVKDCIDAGHVAVGLEGSDYSKKHQRACWPMISNYLFTCDITRNFDVYEKPGKRMAFDAITMWEVIEHLREQDLPGLVKNVKKHLSPSGLWIMSVSSNEEVINGVRLHQTVKPKEWWVEKFGALGMAHMEKYYPFFNGQYVRGRKESKDSFHLILSPSPENAPEIPAEPITHRLADAWFGSKPHMFLKKLVTEEW